MIRKFYTEAEDCKIFLQYCPYMLGVV